MGQGLNKATTNDDSLKRTREGRNLMTQKHKKGQASIRDREFEPVFKVGQASYLLTEIPSFPLSWLSPRQLGWLFSMPVFGLVQLPPSHFAKKSDPERLESVTKNRATCKSRRQKADDKQRTINNTLLVTVTRYYSKRSRSDVIKPARSHLVGRLHRASLSDQSWSLKVES